MKKIILSLCCVVALASCKKAGPEGPQGPQGPAGPQGPSGGSNSGTGIITGNIKQYDQYAVEHTANLNTTTVTIEGTNISTVTDAVGNYTLSNLGSGIYDLSIHKANTGLSKKQQIVFPGTGTLFMGGSVYDKPTFTFSSAYVIDTVVSGNHLQKVNVATASDTKRRYMVLVYGKTASVDLADPASYTYLTSFNINANNAGYNATFSYANAQTNNFPSGSVMYVKIYPISSVSSAYYNYMLNKEVYTSYGTPFPTTFSITMP